MQYQSRIETKSKCSVSKPVNFPDDEMIYDTPYLRNPRLKSETFSNGGWRTQMENARIIKQNRV